MTAARESPALARKSLQKRPVGFRQLSRCLQVRTSNHPRQGSAGDIETLGPREMPDILPPILDMPRTINASVYSIAPTMRKKANSPPRLSMSSESTSPPNTASCPSDHPLVATLTKKRLQFSRLLDCMAPSHSLQWFSSGNGSFATAIVPGRIVSSERMSVRTFCTARAANLQFSGKMGI